MVVFICNACGSSLKKSQVEKHWRSECRNCEVLSCIDCGKDFYGDEYVEHTKCISEAQKYQGALYKESGGGGKGEKKQQEWLERLRQSVSSAAVSPKLAGLLERISEYPNIPRKKAKFVNFVRNSINVRDSRTLEELWAAFSGANDQPSGSSQSSDPPCHGENPSITNDKPMTEIKTTRKPDKKRDHTKSNPNDSSETDSKPVVEWNQDHSSDSDAEPVKPKKPKRKNTETNGESPSQRTPQETTSSGIIEDSSLPWKKKKRHKETEGDDLPLLEQQTLLEAVPSPKHKKNKKKHKDMKEEQDDGIQTDSGVKRKKQKDSLAEQEGIKRPKLDESIIESSVTISGKKLKKKHKHSK